MSLNQIPTIQYLNFFSAFAAQSLYYRGKTVDFIEISRTIDGNHVPVMRVTALVFSKHCDQQRRTPVYFIIYDDIVTADASLGQSAIADPTQPTAQPVTTKYNSVDTSVHCVVTLNSKNPYNYARTAYTAAMQVDDAIDAAHSKDDE